MAAGRDQQSARIVLHKAWDLANTSFSSKSLGQIVAPCKMETGVWLSENGFSFTVGTSPVVMPTTWQQILKDGSVIAKLDAASFDKRTSVAVDQVNLLEKNELASLGLDTKLRLLQEINTKTMSSAQMAARRKIYKSLTLDPKFVAWDDEKRKALIDKLKNNDDIISARKEWKTMPTDKRIELLSKVAIIQAEIYGFYEVPIVGRHFINKDGSENGKSNGNYDPNTEEISININEKSQFDSFSASINLIVHENSHNMQAQLAEKYYKGKLLVTDERYDQAKIFYNNYYGGYVYPNEDPNVNSIILDMAYKKQPLEEHAWKTGDEVGAALRSSLWERLNF